MPKLSDNIAKAYDRTPPDGFASRHGAVAMPSPDALVGLELEIEGWQWLRRHPGFRFTEDGSLRNEGIEAISEPVRLMHAPGLLQSFFHAFPVTEANYSERCSLHTHLNVYDFTFEQLATLCLTYQALERCLFAFVGNDRDKNIFCVPWSQSGINYTFVYNLTMDADNLSRRWQKYTALNLAPVRAQGTVEFRHLHGTKDVELITNWLRIIGRMREYAMGTSLAKLTDTIKAMNTVSNYGRWLEDVFQQDTNLLRREGFEKNLSLGVVDTKFMLIQPQKQKKRGYTTAWLDDVPEPLFAAAAQELRVDARGVEAMQEQVRVAGEALRAAVPRPRQPQAVVRPARNRGDYWSPFGTPRLAEGEQVTVVQYFETVAAAQAVINMDVYQENLNWWIGTAVLPDGHPGYALKAIERV